MLNFHRLLWLCLLTSNGAYASSGGVEVVNWYHLLASSILGAEAGKRWWPVFASVSVLFFMILLAIIAGFWKLKPEELDDEALLPPKSFGICAFFEMAWGVASSGLIMVLGEKHWEKFASILGGTFFFILLNNLSGIIPGFTPATEQMNLNLVMGLGSFILFNFVGLKYGGLNYIKHFFGPVPALALLLFIIEFIGACARPFSLGLRLSANISGDHLVYGIFLGLQETFLHGWLAWFPFPVFLLAFGTLVACLQAFIFMTLSAVYTKLALDTAGSHHH